MSGRADNNELPADPWTNDPLRVGELIAAQLMQMRSAPKLIDAIAAIERDDLLVVLTLLFSYHRRRQTPKQFEAWCLGRSDNPDLRN